MAFNDEDFSDATFGRTVRRGSVIRHRRNSGTSNSQAESSHQASNSSIQTPTPNRNIALPPRRAPAGGGAAPARRPIAPAIAATSASAGVPHASSHAARVIRAQDPRPEIPADADHNHLRVELAYRLAELPTRPLVSPSREYYPTARSPRAQSRALSASREEEVRRKEEGKKKKEEKKQREKEKKEREKRKEQERREKEASSKQIAAAAAASTETVMKPKYLKKQSLVPPNRRTFYERPGASQARMSQHERVDSLFAPLDNPSEDPTPSTSATPPSSSPSPPEEGEKEEGGTPPAPARRARNSTFGGLDFKDRKQAQIQYGAVRKDAGREPEVEDPLGEAESQDAVLLDTVVEASRENSSRTRSSQGTSSDNSRRRPERAVPAQESSGPGTPLESNEKKKKKKEEEKGSRRKALKGKIEIHCPHM